MRRRLPLLVALVATALVGVPRAHAAPVPAAPRVAIFGDSLVWEAKDELAAIAEQAGIDLHLAAFGGVALCDLLPELRAALDERYDVVVGAFVGNNISPCAGGLDGLQLGRRYADGARLAAASARPPTRLLWVTPPKRYWPDPNADAVAEAFRHAPGAEVVDGGPLITPGGQWVRTMPCLPFEPCTGPVVDGVPSNVVRSPDSGHFCPTGRPAVAGVTGPCDVYSSGARRYALTILLAVQDRLPGR